MLMTNRKDRSPLTRFLDLKSTLSHLRIYFGIAGGTFSAFGDVPVSNVAGLKTEIARP